MYRKRKSIYTEQDGGGKCSLCGASGVNRSTCPFNPNAKNPKATMHNKAPVTKTGENVAKKKVDTLQPCKMMVPDIEEEAREYVYITKDYIYKILSPTEQKFTLDLQGTGLTPKVAEVIDCTYNGVKSTMFKIERYDGTFTDWLQQNKGDTAAIGKALRQIIDKSLLLNKKYKIRHDDFHGENIVYRERKNKDTEFAFIDFELSTKYDDRGNVIMSGLPKNKIANHLTFDPYFDLAHFQIYGFYSPDYTLNIVGLPDTSMEHFMSTLEPADLELIEELNEENAKKKVVNVNI